MNHEESRHPIERSWDERWLEDALSSYGASEPRPGLETRILANLETRAVRRQRRWVFAFAAAAAVLFVALIANLRYAKSGDTPNSGLGTRPSGPQNVFPDMGNKMTTRSRKADSRMVRAPGATERRNRPNAKVMHAESAPGSNPSGSEPDGAEAAKQEPLVPDVDQSDAVAASSEVVAREESTPSTDPSAHATPPVPQPSMPEIRISGLNIKPIHIKEITSGRTTD